jgi:hypothetical protein
VVEGQARLQLVKLDERVADLEHLPGDLAESVSRADFIERTMIVFRAKLNAIGPRPNRCARPCSLA